jgi:hypothetical protein
MPGAWRARDVLTGESCPLCEGELQVDVPAGAFRVLDLERS